MPYCTCTRVRTVRVHVGLRVSCTRIRYFLEVHDRHWVLLVIRLFATAVDFRPPQERHVAPAPATVRA